MLNGDPAPSTGGMNLLFQPLSFVQLSGGIGGYTNSLSNAPRNLWNYTLGGFAGYFLAGISYVLTAGLLNWVSVRDWWLVRTNIPSSAAAPSSLSTLGFGARFMFPQFSLSPVLGIHSSHLHVIEGTPLGFSQDGWLQYWDLGLEYRGQKQVRLGAGYQICPAHQSACGAYLNLSWIY